MKTECDRHKLADCATCYLADISRRAQPVLDATEQTLYAGLAEAFPEIDDGRMPTGVALSLRQILLEAAMHWVRFNKANGS